MLRVHQKTYDFPGFRLGYYNLKAIDQNNVKAQLSRILGIKNNLSFLNYLYGKLEPSQSQAKAIEEVFIQYNFKPNEVWGMLPEKDLAKL